MHDLSNGLHIGLATAHCQQSMLDESIACQLLTGTVAVYTFRVAQHATKHNIAANTKKASSNLWRRTGLHSA